MGGGRITRNLSVCCVAMTAKHRNTSSIERSSLGPQLGGKAPHSQDVEIPAPEWTEFLKSFTDQHQGWRVSVTVISGYERSVKVTGSPLQDVVLNRRGTHFTIRISVVGPQGPHVIHEVINPVRLTFKRDTQGAHQGLDITAAEGSITTVRFRTAALPETLDGVLPEVHNVNCR